VCKGRPADHGIISSWLPSSDIANACNIHTAPQERSKEIPHNQLSLFSRLCALGKNKEKKKGKRLGRKSYQSSFTHERSGATQYIHLYVMPFISWSDCTYIDINEISSLLLEKKIRSSLYSSSLGWLILVGCLLIDQRKERKKFLSI